MRRVAVLGTGIMGAGMARTLLRAGLGVKVWNRSPGRAEPLAADGAHVTGTAAEAPAGVLWAQTSAASPHDAGGRPPALAGSRGARTAARRGHTTVRCHRRRTVWASERPADGTRLKLVANSWAGTVMAATAQAIALAQGLGLDPRAFLGTVRGGAADTPFFSVSRARR